MAMIDAAMMGAVAAEAQAVDAPFGRALLALGKARADVVGMSADLSKYTDILPFAEAFPERFYQAGMAEANMMGIAAGLARVGYTPFVTTYGVFASRRAFDQVAMAIALGRQNVKIFAFLPGLTTPGGPTHQAIEDVALMRSLPNMVVIDPADARELGQVVQAVADHDGPAYVRGPRGVVQIVLPQGYQFEIGKARLLRDGADVGLISTGIMTERALQAADVLAARGVQASVLHASSLKPFDAEAVRALAARVPALVSVENGTVLGGLGSAVSEALAAAGSGVPLTTLGVQDLFPVAGSLDFLLERYGLTPAAIAEQAEAAVRRTSDTQSATEG
ncbi:MAG: transketolase family protein [Chloroflexi bacterium]|nr:transketolase family protein [Chloroflexota bacterium]